MVKDRESISKSDYLKHYLGKTVIASDSDHVTIGELEHVDEEEDVCLIKSGEESHWFDTRIVNLSLKSFKDVTAEHIITIVGEMRFSKERINPCKIVSIQSVDCEEWNPKCKYWYGGVTIRMLDGPAITIQQNWMIKKGDEPVSNIGKLMFLICKLGYDITGEL